MFLTTTRKIASNTSLEYQDERVGNKKLQHWKVSKTGRPSLELMRINWNFSYYWQKVSTQLTKDSFTVHLRIVQFAINRVASASDLRKASKRALSK